MEGNERKLMGGAGGAFFASGLVFFILGVSGNATFLSIGIAFFVIGLVFIGQARKARDNDQEGAP